MNGIINNLYYILIASNLSLQFVHLACGAILDVLQVLYNLIELNNTTY